MNTRRITLSAFFLTTTVVGWSDFLNCNAIASTAVDMIVVNAVVISMDDAAPQFEAFAVRQGRIAEVGDSESISRLVGAETVVLDAKGNTITPGFIDAHCHPRPRFPIDSPFGEVECGPESCASIDDIIKALRAKAAITPTGQWVIGRGYQDTKLGRHLARHDLDLASTQHPIYVGHSSGHLAAVNSFALNLAKITRDTPDPRGGQFDRDDTGEPTGVCRERAKSIVLDAGPERPQPSDQEFVEALRRCLGEFVAKGITSLQVAGTDLATARHLQRAVSMGKSPRVYVMLRSIDEAVSLKPMPEGVEVGDEWLKFGAIKLFHGNSLSGRTCWLYEPYADRSDYYGIPPARSQESLDELIFQVHEAGLQCCVHSNGDREIDMVLTAFGRARAIAAQRSSPSH